MVTVTDLISPTRTACTVTLADPVSACFGPMQPMPVVEISATAAKQE
jgi:hypothetical protein